MYIWHINILLNVNRYSIGVFSMSNLKKFALLLTLVLFSAITIGCGYFDNEDSHFDRTINQIVQDYQSGKDKTTFVVSSPNSIMSIFMKVADKIDKTPSPVKNWAILFCPTEEGYNCTIQFYPKDCHSD